MRDTRGSSSRPNDDWSIVMSNNLTGLKNGLNGLGTWLEHHGIGADTENRARLVFEEIVTNVIRYGFDDGGAHIIHPAASVDGNDLTLRFRAYVRSVEPRTAQEH